MRTRGVLLVLLPLAAACAPIGAAPPAPATTAAADAPRFEGCSAIVGRSVAQGGQCHRVELANSCPAPRHLVVCGREGEAETCQTSAAPVEPDGTTSFLVCPQGPFTLRHAACATPEGCAAFVARRGATRTGDPGG